MTRVDCFRSFHSLSIFILRYSQRFVKLADRENFMNFISEWEEFMFDAFINHRLFAVWVGATSSTWRARAWRTVCGVGIWGVGEGAERRAACDAACERLLTWNLELERVTFGSNSCCTYMYNNICTYSIPSSCIYPVMIYTPDKGLLRSNRYRQPMEPTVCTTVVAFFERLSSL